MQLQYGRPGCPNNFLYKVVFSWLSQEKVQILNPNSANFWKYFPKLPTCRTFEREDQSVETTLCLPLREQVCHPISFLRLLLTQKSWVRLHSSGLQNAWALCLPSLSMSPKSLPWSRRPQRVLLTLQIRVATGELQSLGNHKLYEGLLANNYTSLSEFSLEINLSSIMEGNAITIF